MGKRPTLSTTEIIIRGICMENKRKPTHPGVVVKEDILKPLNLSVTDAAKDLGVTRKLTLGD
jgi:hypothetical protein